MDFEAMKRLINGYRITTDGWTMNEFEKEFENVIIDHPHEIIGSRTDPKFRFDFARRVFLERGL